MNSTGPPDTRAVLLTLVVFCLFVTVSRELIHHWRSGGSSSPYRTARLEGTTLVLPGRRRSHVSGAVLVASVGLGMVGLGWSSRDEVPIAALLLVGAGGAFVLGSAGLLRWAMHPGEIRMDAHHVTVDGRFYRATLRWEQVTSVHADYAQPRITIGYEPPAMEMEVRQRRGHFLKQTLVIPHLALHRARLVLRLLEDLKDLDVQGRHEVITQGAIPMLTIRARTRSQLNLIYTDEIRPLERHGEAMRRRIQSSPDQPW